MELFVDENRVEVADLQTGTVEDALRRVQGACCAPGRIVIGLRFDGEAVPVAAMAEALQKPIRSLGRLEVMTGTRAELVTDAMNQASACLAETQSACEEAAGLFTEGKTVEAAETLAECLRIWQQIHQAVSRSLEMLGLDPRSAAIDKEPLEELIVRPKDVLLQVRDALSVRDYVLLADILQYEFQDVTQVWQRVIAHLRHQAQRLAAEGAPRA